MCGKSEIDISKVILKAIENVDRNYCRLSNLKYTDDEGTDNLLKKEKYLERPIAYEFYHQFRLLMNNRKFLDKGIVLHGEMDKRYQRVAAIPDFVLHGSGNTKNNLAVVEFKMSERIDKLQKDFVNLRQFRESPLEYDHAFEIIIGTKCGYHKDIKKITEIVQIVKRNGITEIELIYVERETGTVHSTKLKI